jgi:hypothetical protein
MFGLTAYCEILKMFRSAGFHFARFAPDAAPGDLLLRHDIDFSIDDALEIAEAEAEMGISSTFFFMLTSNTYNIASKRNSDLIRKIADLGHEISIHFDPVVYSDIDLGFNQERAFFEDRFGVSVDVVSIHRPGPFLNDNNRQLPGCRHSYEDDFFRKMTYLSDSAGRDIRPTVINLVEAPPTLPLHLLIHPIWWTSSSESPTATLQSWLRIQQEFLVYETRRNCKSFEG